MVSSDGIFDVNSSSLLELLAQPNMRLKIPSYQRPYRWETENVEELWDDIYKAYLNNKNEETQDRNYFLGSLITAKDTENSPYSNIIDGQQRITTLTILFSIIYRFMPEDIEYEDDDEDDLETAKNISKKAVASCIWNENKTRLRFKPKSEIGEKYRNIVKNLSISEIQKYEITRKALQKADATTLYFNTAKIFIEKINELTENGKNINNLHSFNKYLFNNVKMIHIKCGDESFAIKMFQIINNRGLALYSSDLIKSYLFSKFDENTADSQEFEDYWSAVEQKIDSIENMTTDDMFTLYQYYCLGENPKKALDKEIINYINEKNISPTNAIIDFNDFVDKYISIINKNNKDLYALKYIPWQMYLKTILVTSEKLNYANKNELYHLLAQFYYLNFIAGQTLTKIKQTSFNLIKLVKNNTSIKELQQEIDNQLKNYNIITLVKSNLSFENVYNTQWLKPLLLWIEYNELDNCIFIPITRTVQVEHILPEKWEENWNWFPKQAANAYKNSIGNLTLLSGTKNIKASNESYLSKIDVYSGTGREDQCTSYRITQHIFDTYKDEWTSKQILEHANYYYKKIERLLNIDLSDIYYTLE